MQVNVCPLIFCRRIPMSEIPYEDEAKCADWIHKLFQEKVIKKRNPFDKYLVNFDLGSYL